MCLAIPMKVIKIEGDEGMVEAGGLRRRVNLSFVRNIRPGDYVIIHAGFAIEKLNEKAARETLKAINEIR